MKALKSIKISLIIILIIYILSIITKSRKDEEVSITYDKVVSFTFDDGPSIYTKEIAKVFLLNNSKATFFELGNRMKYNQDIVKYLIDNNMEVGSHTYSHKDLTALDQNNLYEEINSTLILFNEITDSDIALTRTPYGKINKKVSEYITTPIINWSIDTKDWLYQDEKYLYEYILQNVKDGDLVLMHDTYYSTLQAVKKVLPALIESGYKITTVSEMAELKGVKLEKGKQYRSFN